LKQISGPRVFTGMAKILFVLLFLAVPWMMLADRCDLTDAQASVRELRKEAQRSREEALRAASQAREDLRRVLEQTRREIREARRQAERELKRAQQESRHGYRSL
jgi:F0F1-type ATP synthase membrane subunit b/b'